MKSSDLNFNCVNFLLYKCHKINLKCGGSNPNSPDWIKKTTTNAINDDDKCFQYTATVVLNHKKITKISQKRSNIKPFINRYG